MTMFLITDDRGDVRLKSYEASIKGKVTTLRLSVEVTDPYALAHVLESLEKLLEAAKQPAKAAAPAQRRSKSKSIGHQVLLALPPPSREGDDL